ncbi:hypothetical protein L6164_024168 [Bauhinia variegata]|uniref:Uncharacterized protein n=1 Tax=Bauhinia variegata TaxID=167791 RepID=A0ACB9LWP9_BAUVA|nr:hypothetical protein L6164_024168 [Bauhinia variegata]
MNYWYSEFLKASLPVKRFYEEVEPEPYIVELIKICPIAGCHVMVLTTRRADHSWKRLYQRHVDQLRKLKAK